VAEVMRAVLKAFLMNLLRDFSDGLDMRFNLFGTRGEVTIFGNSIVKNID
jgi:hypothetical protein